MASTLDKPGRRVFATPRRVEPDSDAQRARTQAALEWPLLLERFAQRCASRASADYARELMPAATLEAARVRLARTRQALVLADAGHELPARELPEIGELLERGR